MRPPAPSEKALHRIARAVVRAEVLRQRGSGSQALPTIDWLDQTPIGEDGLGLDSLERLGALGALAAMFGMRDDTLPEPPPERVGDWFAWIRSGRTDTDPIYVETSGSTGRPKSCRHEILDLAEEVDLLANLFPGRRRVVALVPTHHLYGLVWTALLPDALGVEVVDRRMGSPLQLASGDLVVGVPAQWETLARIGNTPPADVVAVSSAGSLTDEVARRLLAMGFERVLDVYGSSETGAIAVREAPAIEYELLSRWRLGRDREDGLINASGRFYPLPDHVELLGDRLLRPVSRRDGAVSIGGRNVWPERVADVLRTVRGVDEVSVRMGSHGRLKAFVVPCRDNAPDDLAHVLRTAAAERLPEEERPTTYEFGPALPRNAMGKESDWS